MNLPVEPRADLTELCRAIERLVDARAAHATVCPSEVARAIAGDDGPWRALMPSVREAAAVLVRQGRLSVTRRGEEVDGLDPGGPVRLGRPRR